LKIDHQTLAAVSVYCSYCLFPYIAVWHMGAVT